MKTRLLAVLIPALACVAFAAPAGAAAAESTSEAVSENWAGYEATTSSTSTSGDDAGFSAASGSWTEPTVKASSAQSYSAYWVGLGGGGESSSALEQEGTQADVSSTGKVSYYAWYELVPSAPVKITSVAVHPGDRIWARTAVKGDRVTVELDNKTTGQDFTKTLTMTRATPDTSTAEWVAEAPSECQGGASGECQPLALSDFGSVRFTNAYATSNGSTKSVSGWNDTAIELSPSSSLNYGYGGGYGGGFGSTESDATTSSGSGAAPGALSADGTSFTVTYGAQDATASGSGDGSSGLSGSGAGDSGYGYGYGYPGYGGSGYSGSGYGDSGYGDSGYGDSGYVVPGFGGSGDSGSGDSGAGYGGSGYGGYGYPGYGYAFSYGSAISPYAVYAKRYASQAYSGTSSSAGAGYGY